jgi:N-acetylglucosamine-6-sulfatase
MKSSGMYIPLYPDSGGQSILRYEYGSPAAEFPSNLKRKETVNNAEHK